jgi:hypothetical protein
VIAMLRALLLPTAGALPAGGVLLGGKPGKALLATGPLLFSLAVLLVLIEA